MKTIKYSIFLWTCTTLLFVSNALAFDEVTKKISEKYNVSSSDKLNISNKYGKVDIYTWDKSEITVEITMKAWASSSSRAKDELDRITIKYGQSGNFITFETQIAGNNVNINNNRGFEINYVVNMPRKNALKVYNKYGATFLDNFSGELDLSTRYGQLRTKRLTGVSKNIEVAYGGIDSEEIEKGKIKISYSNNCKIRTGGNIELDKAYGNITFDKIGSLQVDIRYGELRIEETAEVVRGKLGYSSIKIKQLTKSLVMEARYGGDFNIEKVMKGFEKIELDGSYTSFDLAFEAGNTFDFEVNVAYNDFRNGISEAQISKQIEANNSKEYVGYVGKKGGAKVIVSTRYGGVRFKTIKKQ
jgi:hypothetical protein